MYDPHLVQVILLWALVADVLIESGTKGEGTKEREEDKWYFAVPDAAPKCGTAAETN